MALGDIVSCSINPTSWQAIITISGMGPSGIYNLGLGTNNSISSPNQPKITFNLTSSGYNDEGNPTGINRTIYGTTGIRLPYPNETQKDEIVENGNIILKIGLSDYIYQKDADITVNILSGYYTSGLLISSGITNLSVTNNSELNYPKVIGNWSWPAFDTIKNNTYPLKCIAFHSSAQQGRPVRTVKFIANDEHGNYTSGIVNNITIDNNAADQVPICEYIYNLPTEGFITGDSITGNFIAYPWYGDSGSILNTNDGINPASIYQYGPINLLNNISGNYGTTVCVVDSITGNNNAGQTVDINNFDANNPPAAYRTIHSGARAISVFNNTNRSRNDVGGGIIFLKSGNHTWVSGSTTYGNPAKTYITVTSFPGELRDNVVIDRQNGNGNLGHLVCCSGISFIGSSSDTFTSIRNLWLNNCYINNGGSRFISTVSGCYITNCLIPGLRQGFKQFSSEYAGFALIRGNYFSGFGSGSNIYLNTVIGNLRTSGQYSSLNNNFNINYSSNNFGPSQGPILAYNKFMGLSCPPSTPLETTDKNTPNYIGFVCVQNVMENISSAGGSPLISLWGDGNTGVISNVLIWHNDLVGQRSNICYNDANPTGFLKTNWSFKNNILDVRGIKTDLFIHPSFGRNGNRTGNWAHNFGVNSEGNFYSQLSGTTPEFVEEFPGLDCIVPTINNGPSFAGFVNRASCEGDGIAAGTGNGDYRVTSTSPMIGLTNNLLLLYDIMGNQRYSGDVPGAYSFSLSNSNILTSSGNIGQIFWGNPYIVYKYSNFSNNKLFGI